MRIDEDRARYCNRIGQDEDLGSVGGLTQDQLSSRLGLLSTLLMLWI